LLCVSPSSDVGGTVSAQNDLNLPLMPAGAEVKQRIALTDITINYIVRGEWTKDLGSLFRTESLAAGANEQHHDEFRRSGSIEGQPLAKEPTVCT